jgi:hypothetical protein
MQITRSYEPVTSLPRPETACVGQTWHDHCLAKSVFRDAGMPGPAEPREFCELRSEPETPFT